MIWFENEKGIRQDNDGIFTYFNELWIKMITKLMMIEDNDEKYQWNDTKLERQVLISNNWMKQCRTKNFKYNQIKENKLNNHLIDKLQNALILCEKKIVNRQIRMREKFSLITSMNSMMTLIWFVYKKTCSGLMRTIEFFRRWRYNGLLMQNLFISVIVKLFVGFIHCNPTQRRTNPIVHNMSDARIISLNYITFCFSIVS